MDHVEHLCAVTPADGRQLHRRAIADGRGQLLDPDAERLAGADELVALTLPEFASLGVFAMLTGAPSERGGARAIALSHGANGVLPAGRPRARRPRTRQRLPHDRLDRTRPPRRPRQGPRRGDLEPDELPITMLVEAAAHALAHAVIAFPGDRHGVPEALTDALGSLMDLYALAHDTATRQ
jgi:hypothetical protein